MLLEEYIKQIANKMIQTSNSLWIITNYYNDLRIDAIEVF